jgi:hypothetical protein
MQRCPLLCINHIINLIKSVKITFQALLGQATKTGRVALSGFTLARTSSQAFFISSNLPWDALDAIAIAAIACCMGTSWTKIGGFDVG